MPASEEKSLYARLGGYDTAADHLVSRLRTDARLGRFKTHRGDSAGGPLLYTGRDMQTSHKGMGVFRPEHQGGHRRSLAMEVQLKFGGAVE